MMHFLGGKFVQNRELDFVLYSSTRVATTVFSSILTFGESGSLLFLLLDYWAGYNSKRMCNLKKMLWTLWPVNFLLKQSLYTHID